MLSNVQLAFRAEYQQARVSQDFYRHFLTICALFLAHSIKKLGKSKLSLLGGPATFNLHGSIYSVEEEVFEPEFEHGGTEYAESAAFEGQSYVEGSVAQSHEEFE